MKDRDPEVKVARELRWEEGRTKSRVEAARAEEGVTEPQNCMLGNEC